MPNSPFPAAITIEGLATDYAAGEWIAPHVHDAHQIIHVDAGVLRVVSGNHSWFVLPGRAIWMPAGRVHAIRFQTRTQMRTVYIRGAAPAFPDHCAVWSVSPLMREILIRFAKSPDPKGREHLAALLFLEIGSVTTLPFHLPLPGDSRLRSLTDAVSTDPANAQLLKDWARTLGMSERNLIRKFNAETGMTFRQWRRQARLLGALERLAAGKSVTTVAFEVGYESVSAFVAAFREAFGEPPKRYVLHTPLLRGERFC